MRDIIFLRQPINSATRQVLWRNKFNLLPKHPNRHENYFFVWKRSLFGRIDFTKSKVKTWRFYTRPFFFLYRKVIIILKYKLSTLEGLLFFLGCKKTSRSVGNRVFDQIKRERKEKVATSKKKETLTFFSTAKIIFSSFFFFSFSWLKGYRSL